ncbi:hypothetical protein PMAYCL1PPCAC_03693 [Pristionchus mayeri]|uniref:SAP domain-containing protein n=1 Tax=Pristionchus mayeri TaxID=1317129 RepID=A0AAN5C1M9_9BILA|nr:hypothetical protein PMAYCL1PPCAC_03693 [Pristionchus mayeri]
MATRASSRRSAGGADVLNRAMISLLPLSRLKEECEKRGLETAGTQLILSSRLEDCLDGIYVPPAAVAAPTGSTGSTPSTSRNASANTTPKSLTSSTKAPAPKRTARRRTSVASVTSTGEEGSTVKSTEIPPKKKPRRNSTKKDVSSREHSLPPKEEEVYEEEFSVTIVAAPAVAQFDSDDDQPLIRVQKEPIAAISAEPAAEVENGGDVVMEAKKKKKKRRKEDEDVETGAVLARGDSEWVPPEELERRVTRVGAKKRARRNTMETKGEEADHVDSPSASMPVLDPEIYDQDANEDEEDKAAKANEQPAASNEVQRKTSSGDGGDSKVKKEFSSGTALDRPRSISIATPPAAVIAKERRRESAAAPIIRPPKEKPATQKYAELMMQKKAAEEARARALTTANGGSAAATPPTAAAKGEKDEGETSGGASPLVIEKTKPEPIARRDSVGAVGSPAGDGSAPRGFAMVPRKNAPPRPSATASGISDLLGGILEKQQGLLEKKPKSISEAEAEKIRITHEMKQRAPDLRNSEENVKRLQKEKEEKERAREERERKERERKISVIAASSRPIPPPPPPPAEKQDSPPATQHVSSPTAVEPIPATNDYAAGSTPKYEPLEETDQINDNPVGKSDDAPEYEPLSPSLTLPPLDRSIVDAHHRARREKMGRRKEEGQRDYGHSHKEHGHKDHGPMARDVPLPNDPFALALTEKMMDLQRLRGESPITEEIRECVDPVTDEIRECMEDLLKRVESKVEKETKWERRTKRKSEYQMQREKAEEKKRAQMLSDPRAFLAKASNILESINNDSMEEDKSDSPSTISASANAVFISQDLAEPGTYEEDPEDKRMPEFHGEPVPSDDDEALFLEAAGLPKKDKKPKHPVVEEEAPPSHEHILMDYYNACLHIKSATDKPWLIEPDNENGLALMWGGVRTNHGYVLPWREEKKCLVFQIKITEHQSIRHIPFMEQEPYDVRVGFSLRASGNIMGEAPLSWAFSTTGKKCVNNVFQEWGNPIEIGEIVTAVFDVSSRCISFYRNEECMGVAFKDVSLPDGDAIYAHVCVKNCKVVVNLGDFPEVEGGWGMEGGVNAAASNAPSVSFPRDSEWRFPTEIERKHFEMSRLPPNEKAACTLLMMVGLPGVGKSTWVRQYTRDHPEEKWDVINAEAVMAAMKVNGVPRGRAHTGRWDMVLGLVAKALQKMVLLAARRRRNYIVDLSNVNKDSRKRRLMHFKDFTKKCIVIIPDEDEMVNRQMKQTRQEGASHVPAEAILEMKAVFTFPTEDGDGFDEVHLIEPAMPRIAEAIEIIQRFNDEGKPWYQKRYRGRGSRRGGRGGYMGDRDRRGSDVGRPLSVSTAHSNGSGPPTGVGRSMASPGGAWGMGESPSTAGNFTWASRKSSN